MLIEAGILFIYCAISVEIETLSREAQNPTLNHFPALRYF